MDGFRYYSNFTTISIFQYLSAFIVKIIDETIKNFEHIRNNDHRYLEWNFVKLNSDFWIW